MKLDRDVIVMALAWYEVVGKKIGSVTVPYDELEGICDLIRELTEENESLKEMNKALAAGFETIKADLVRAIFEEIDAAHEECIHIDPTTNLGYLLRNKFEHKLAELKKKYTEGEVCIKAATVQNMQTRFALHFGTYTDNDTVMVRDLFKLLNKFAEEEMEGKG